MIVPRTPPRPDTSAGARRRVGVEIEFAGLGVEPAAALLCQLFGGEPRATSAHRWVVEGTRWGEFVVELDSQYAHPDAAIVDREPAGDSEWEEQRHRFRVNLHTRARALVGDLVAGLVPTEIVCPPVPWDQLDDLDRLFPALRSHGAEGTDASLLYGFGLHLNPEVPSTEPEVILAHLQAYVLCARWLRREIDVDLTRSLLPYANPFPEAYVRRILDPDYAPDLSRLIADYLADNPTRNRELDMLPLFAHLCPEHPHPLLHGGLVKPRPTFHYRLPDARLSQPGWCAAVEWNRWLEVERLAADPGALGEFAAAYLAEEPAGVGWWERLRRWMEAS